MPEPTTADSAERQDGVARLFDAARQTYMSYAPHEPGIDLYWVVGQLVDPATVVFFDWAPVDGQAPGSLSGAVVLVTNAAALIHIEYDNVNSYADDDDRKANIGTLKLTLRRTSDVMSVRWNIVDIESKRAGLSEADHIVVEGTDFTIEIPTNRHKKSRGHFEHFSNLTKALGYA